MRSITKRKARAKKAKVSGKALIIGPRVVPKRMQAVMRTKKKRKKVRVKRAKRVGMTKLQGGTKTAKKVQKHLRRYLRRLRRTATVLKGQIGMAAITVMKRSRERLHR